VVPEVTYACALLPNSAEDEFGFLGDEAVEAEDAELHPLNVATAPTATLHRAR